MATKCGPIHMNFDDFGLDNPTVNQTSVSVTMCGKLGKFTRLLV